MPSRSSDSSVLRWPDRAVVLSAARQWAASVRAERPEIEAIGCFGSYARGDWGVGSDLDLVAIVSASTEPFARRALAFDLSHLPVPAEILVYVREEWQRLLARDDRFARTMRGEVVWLA